MLLLHHGKLDEQHPRGRQRPITNLVLPRPVRISAKSMNLGIRPRPEGAQLVAWGENPRKVARRKRIPAPKGRRSAPGPYRRPFGAFYFLGVTPTWGFRPRATHLSPFGGRRFEIPDASGARAGGGPPWAPLRRPLRLPRSFVADADPTPRRSFPSTWQAAAAPPGEQAERPSRTIARSIWASPDSWRRPVYRSILGLSMLASRG